MKVDDEITGWQRRFDVEVLIAHPTIDPSEIDAALGLVGTHVHRAGDPRVTPQGRELPGNWPDTRWRYSKRYAVTHQWFVEEMEELLKELQPHQLFFKRLHETGGVTSLIIQFLGDDGYFGDSIPVSALTTLVELGIGLSIEVYTVPQH